MISDESVTISKRGRFWAVHDEAGELICICVYKRGALEVARRLSLDSTSSPCYLRETATKVVGEAPRSSSLHQVAERIHSMSRIYHSCVRGLYVLRFLA